ncbi:MAG: MFS transporter [Bacteroidales bacterium]|nr:MFS transporter [Bacteroidales bacterium]
MEMGNPVIKDRNLHIIFSVTLIAVMGVASITPAFPAIIKHFGIEKPQIGLLITVFTIPGVILTPIMGILADRLGRKTILIPSLLLFSIGGAACIIAPNFHVLLICRFFQGIGAATLGSINVTLIGDLYQGLQRTEAMGLNASILSIGTASYPFIGGILAHSNWNYPFLLPLLAIPCAIWVVTSLKNVEPDSKQNLKDYLNNTWKTINQRKVWALFTINVLIFVVLYGSYLSYFPLLLQDRFGSDTREIGIVMSAFSICTAIVASQSKRIHKLIHIRGQLILSFIFYTMGMVFLSFVSTYALLAIPIISFGLGHGMVIPGIQNILVGYAPMKERAAFMSINSMVLRLGQTIGPLYTGLLFTFGGLPATFLGGAFISLLMLAIWIFIKE